jgi:hypothetical protein
VPALRRRVRRLRLNDGRPMCSRCCGNFHRISYGSLTEREAPRERSIERLRKLIDAGPARLNPRPGRVLDRRWSLTVSLRRAQIVNAGKCCAAGAPESCLTDDACASYCGHRAGAC